MAQYNAERSIEARAAGLALPTVADRALIGLSAEQYAGMCTGCHLAPGMDDNEIRQGLYPKPPNLSERRDRSPAESFWIIERGLKIVGVPAWGVTHDDESIWGLAAFLQQLPALDAGSCAALAEAEVTRITITTSTNMLSMMATKAALIATMIFRRHAPIGGRVTVQSDPRREWTRIAVTGTDLGLRREEAENTRPL